MRDHKITEFFETCINNLVQKPSIIRDPLYLSDSWVPEHILHREKEISRIFQLISPILRNQKSPNILLYGPTGSGKTLSAKYLIRKLNTIHSLHKYPIKCIYVNCRFYGNKSGVFHYILREIVSQLTGTPIKDGTKNLELINKLFNILQSKQLRLIVVFDEIDTLIKNCKEDDFLYLITRDDHLLGKSHLCFIGISNTLDFVHYLDARTYSSLNSMKVKFMPYDAKQLYDILYERASKSLISGSYSTEILSYISAWVAKESGDARKAITILRLSANIADLEGANKISIDHVNRAIDGYDIDAFMSIIETLTTHFKLIILSTLDLQFTRQNSYDSFVDVADVYNTYVNLCNTHGFKPLSKDNFNKKIKQLETFLGDYLESYIKSLGKKGRRKVIKLNIDYSKAKKIIKHIESLL